jgi:hypothetical protein
MKRRLWLLASLILTGCDCGGGGGTIPGRDSLGTYELRAKGIYANCNVPSFPMTFDYVGTFSRLSDGGQVFYVDGNIRYDDAGFDGQFASYELIDVASNLALFDGGSCSPCESKRVERATLALLSASQAAALGDAGCPINALDGGLPMADEDAGITLPTRLEDGGFDAVLACGELQVIITSEGFCDQSCYSCRQQWRVSGVRSK